jgi:hypothetical protein
LGPISGEGGAGTHGDGYDEVERSE